MHLTVLLLNVLVVRIQLCKNPRRGRLYVTVKRTADNPQKKTDSRYGEGKPAPAGLETVSEHESEDDSKKISL
jgi:hypothetical protein